MSRKRTYQDHEVRQILDWAIGQDDVSTPSLPAGDGLTLRELQEVGREVGLAPSRIAEAVAAFEGRGEAVPRTTALGLPTSVGRVISLPRSPTDLEWERLIAELRTTFGGKGEVSSHGSLREWSYGTLHAFVEPVEKGYRLRLVDSRAAALGVGILAGGFLLVFGLLIFLVLLGKDNPGFKLLVPLLFSLGGGSIITLSTMALPGWAREQEKRMEHMCRYSMSLLPPPAPRDE